MCWLKATVPPVQKQHGIYISNTCDNPIVRGNRVFDNHMCGIHMNGDASQGGAGVITNALIENNIIYGNGEAGGSAINCDGVCNSRIQNNLIYDNHSSGISLYRDNAAAGATGNLVVNNTIVMASNARWAINIKGGSKNNTVYNNILYDLNYAHGSITIATDSIEGFASDYNLVDGHFSANDEDMIKLPDWRSQTGNDQHSVMAKPGELFVNAAGGDYRLCVSSPAIGAGTRMAVPKDPPANDLTGSIRPAGKACDIVLSADRATAYGGGGDPSRSPILCRGCASGHDRGGSVGRADRYTKSWDGPLAVFLLRAESSAGAGGGERTGARFALHC